MERVKGIDTIKEDITISPPKEIAINFGIMEKWQRAQSLLAPRWIAIIPYCVKCKTPLTWVMKDERVLFECPKCGVVWVKENGWDKKLEKELAKLEEKNGICTTTS